MKSEDGSRIVDPNKLTHEYRRKKWLANYHSDNGWIKTALRRYRKRALQYGVEFDLTFQDIVIPAKCPVLGIPLKIGGRRRHEIKNSPSLDRVDNSKGYVRGNVRVISHRANSLKSDATLDEFRRVYTYMRKATAVP